MPDSRPPRSTWLVRFLAVLAAYYVGGRIGLTVPYVGSHISLIWPPTGIALAALLRWELSLWPAVWLGAFGVNLAVGGSPLLAFGIACGNTLGPWLAARELRRRKFDPRLPRRHDLLLYLGIGVLGGMAINASNGVLQLWLAELLPAPAIGAAWGTWWLGDAMGALVMGIPLLTASREGWHALIFGRRGRELLVLMLLTVGLGAWVFEGHAAAMPANPLLYLPFFLLSWLAIRGGANLASTAALLLSAQAVWATAQGGGPFQSPDLHLSLAMLWGYMATATVITVLITVLVDELRTSERRLTLATMGGQLGLWEWHLPTDKVTYAGDFHAVLGVASERRDAGAGAVFARVHPEDRDLLEQRLAAHLAGATRFFEAEYRIQEHQRTTWVQARGQVVERDAAGAPVRMAGTLLDVSDRKQSEAAFAKESHKREALLHAASDGIHVLDSRGRVLEASDSFCEMLGYARGELLGMHVSQWDAQWSAEELDERILPRLHEERSTFETQHRCRDGRVFDAEISTIGVDIDGERLLYCSARDITGRKRAEHDMRESRTRMRALLDACDESVMLLTPEGRLLAINAFGAERFGMPPERMLGQDFLALLPPDLADTRRTSLAETVASAGPVHLQDQRDGIFFDVSLYPVMDESGKVESIAVYAKDVTERKEAEEALRRSEERWKFALEGAEAGVYDWNVETGAVFFSTRAREVLGFREDEHILTLAQWESRLHPLDMPRRRSALHEHLDGHKPIYVCEYRYRTATRGWKWILARGIVAEHTADGRPLRMIGTFIDIDAQRRSAKADALRSRALEMLAQGGELKSIFDTVIIGLEEEDPSFGFAVLLVDDDGQFSIGSAPGLLFTPQSERFELSGKISAGGRVAVLGEPLVLDIPDAAYLRSVEAIAASAEVEFCWSEPLMLAPEKTGGALLAFRRNAEEAHLPKIETLQHTAQLISIALQRKHADAQLQLASSVYEASGEAIIVVDGDNRIIAVNPAFSHLTGYAAFEVLGKDPKILKSGRNDEAKVPTSSLKLPGSHSLADKRLTEDGDVIAAMEALARFERQTRKVKLERNGKLEDYEDPHYARELPFLAGQANVSRQELPKPGGSSEFEVIGIPLAKPGY
ncbi:MAG: PAS domain S-box protein, partial [Zoogloea sp.]|nr:PAS domain S-box protein [Zoogloea sp.]